MYIRINSTIILISMNRRINSAEITKKKFTVSIKESALKTPFFQIAEK
jgi:hypothetical protein